MIEASQNFGISSLTFHKAWGIEKQKGHTDLCRGAEFIVDFLPKIKIELLISDDIAKQVVSIIKEKAQIENMKKVHYLFATR